jgi:hypothetical protein
MSRAGFWPMLAVTTVNAVFGAFFSLAMVPAVAALYERGYGRFSAVLFFVVMPVAGLVISTVTPAWLWWRGNAPVATGIGVGGIFYWLAYFFLVVVPVAAI